MENLSQLLSDEYMVYIVVGIGLLFILVLIMMGVQRRRHRRELLEQPDRDLYDDHYFDDPPPANRFERHEPDFDEPPVLDDVVHSPQQPRPPEEELIIALFIRSEKEMFAGTDIFSVLEEVGLKYGDMQIFHHHGMGEMKVKNPVFSIANMLEPGTFKPNHMDNFATPGLVCFMRLPGPFNGRVAFELMINNAQRIADILEGVVVDEQQHIVDQTIITHIRKKIELFEMQ